LSFEKSDQQHWLKRLKSRPLHSWIFEGVNTAR